MSRSIVETLIGAFVIIVAVLFLNYSYTKSNIGTPDGYRIYADFSGTGGLSEGDDVRISGVKIGGVTGVELVPETYLARVHMSIDQGVRLPVDSAALISSESLMGGRYLQIEVGAEEDMIEDGGRIEFTQAPQNLEQLLGKFIFSMNDKKDETVVVQPVAEVPAVRPDEQPPEFMSDEQSTSAEDDAQ